MGVAGKVVRAVAAASAVCLVAAGAYLFTYHRGMVPLTAPAALPTAASGAELAKLRTTRVFFGHQSVGGNILDGLGQLYTSAGEQPPMPQRITKASELDGTGTDGFLADALIGENGDPMSKITAFDSLIRGGVGEHVDIALMKLCYVDFHRSSDPRAVFEHYRSTMAALERDFPRVTFIYTTAPLTTTGQLANWQRTQYNSLVRSELSGKVLYDIAAVESTDAAGQRATGSVLGLDYELLQPSYSTDGGHLNADGAQHAARALVAVLTAR